jgi:hypothetical protein
LQRRDLGEHELDELPLALREANKDLLISGEFPWLTTGGSDDSHIARLGHL